MQVLYSQDWSEVRVLYQQTSHAFTNKAWLLCRMRFSLLDLDDEDMLWEIFLESGSR